MANYSQLATDRFGLDIFAMTPAALPAPFGIEPLHDWSPAHYARSAQRSTGINSSTLTPYSPYSHYMSNPNRTDSSTRSTRHSTAAQSILVMPPKAAQTVWSRAPWGRISFRTKPDNELVHNYWSYSANGPSDIMVESRLIGDLHFSPSTTSGVAWDFWVCTNSGHGCGFYWAPTAPGYPHPMLPTHVLQACGETKAPRWILQDSYRRRRYT